MKYLSLFSGIGGFEIPLEKMGHESVGFSEIDQNAIDIYLKHFPNHKNYGNADTIIPSELPDFELLVGGFPCQSFSLAGERKGFDDTRGSQFFNIARIIKEKRPRYILLENVKGLLSHDSGRAFKVILSTLNELGYDTESMVLDGSDFKAGQRPRLFIYASYRYEKDDAGEGAKQTAQIYSSICQRPRTSIDTIQEVGRGSSRIIRAFAILPDWLDSWETIYNSEGKTRECCSAECG